MSRDTWNAFFKALALHGLLLGLFALSFNQRQTLVKTQPVPEIIEASVLDEAQVEAQARQLREQEESQRIAEQQRKQKIADELQREKKRLEQIRQKRIAAEKQVKQQALKKKRAEEQAKKAELARRKALEAARLAKIKQQKAEQKARLEAKRRREARLAAEKWRKAEAEAKAKAEQARRQAEEAQRAAQAKRQAAAAKARAARQQEARQHAEVAIQRKVNRSWIRLPSVQKGLQCTIRVKLLASGDVMQAVVVSSSGDPIFDRSAENAVRKASPLPVPSDPELFAREFRTFTFVFRPQ